MQIRANQRISLLNLNAGNITYIFYCFNYTILTVLCIESLSPFPFTVFKCNDDHIYRRLTLLFNITKFSYNERVNLTNKIVVPLLYCLLLYPTCVSSSHKHKLELNQTFTIETINLVPIIYPSYAQ